MRSRHRISIGGSLVVVVCLAASPAAQSQTTDPIPGKVNAWIGAAYAHKAGEIDAAAESIAFWSRDDLRKVLNTATSYFHLFEEFGKGGPPGPSDHKLRFSQFLAMFQRYGITDRVAFRRALRLIAFLHADIAVIHQTPEGYALPSDNKRIFEIDDGRQVAQRSGTIHWEFARTVLDALWIRPHFRAPQIPLPTDDAFTRLWYQATSAVLQQANELSELAPHLVKGRTRFPADPLLLLFEATMREEVAEPRVQNFLNASPASVRGSVQVGNTSYELGQAETRLREALDAEPSYSEARVRLGRILHLRGRHEEALAEFDRALGQPLPDIMKYYALLYAGRAQHTLGHLDAARQAFEGAKTLYPFAQSPWLGLSEVARDEGNRDAAVEALHMLSASPLQVDRGDPLWVYRQIHDPTYEVLLAQLRQAATALRLEANRAMPGHEPTPPAVTGEPR